MIGDYSLTLTGTTIPANTITIVPTIPTVSTIIGDTTYFDFSGNQISVAPWNGPPAQNPQVMSNWGGTFVDPKFALNAAIKDALKSGLRREEIDKMIDEAVCEEVVDS